MNADPDRLTQVVVNLLSNAVKFSPLGAEVWVSIRSGNGRVRIGVRDHGSGIPDEFRRRIFQKFAQADGTDARTHGGSGLGLSIAQQIVVRLGGTIGYEAAPGGGTIFTVELPLWVGDADAGGTEEAAPETDGAGAARQSAAVA